MHFLQNSQPLKLSLGFELGFLASLSFSLFSSGRQNSLTLTSFLFNFPAPGWDEEPEKDDVTDGYKNLEDVISQMQRCFPQTSNGSRKPQPAPCEIEHVGQATGAFKGNFCLSSGRY